MSFGLFCTFFLVEQVSMGHGTITAYALMSLEPRGILFVTPGMEVSICNCTYRIEEDGMSSYDFCIQGDITLFHLERSEYLLYIYIILAFSLIIYLFLFCWGGQSYLVVGFNKVKFL